MEREVLEMDFEEAKEKFPITDEQQDKWIDNFEKFARYLGGGCYTWMGYYADDTRDLFLMGVIAQENNIAYTDLD
jgi:hypothetical protein